MAQVARVRLFGIPRLEDAAGAPLRLRTRKQLGVLLYLVLEGREQAVPRDRLVDLLWSDVTPEQGRHSLAQACSAMRAALGADAVERVGDGVRLRAPLLTDLDVVGREFEGLALTQPLHDIEWWAGAEFAHWVDGARARLRRAAEEALRRTMDECRRAGQSARLQGCADVLYDLDPLSDTAVHALAERELMRGDVVGAIRLLREHLARVREALGCMPHAGVERLLRRLEAGAHPPVELAPPRVAAEPPGPRPATFVGREKELAHLESEWQRAAEGGFRSCLVLGPGGIGKSSLLRRFAATVAARAQPIVIVTCQEIGEGIPFAALSDLITALSREPSAGATDPRWLSELARIHPALRNAYPGIPDPPDAPAESIRLRVAEGLVQMIGAIADGGPLGLVFDDLPFMDPATREVLHVMTRRAAHQAVSLVAAARTPDLLESQVPAYPALAITTWDSTLRVAPLDRGAAVHLALALAPILSEERRVLTRIADIAEGNPHFTEMLVADWERHTAVSLAAGGSSDDLPKGWEPPDSMRQAFARLYRGLLGLPRDVLHVLAVAGRALSITELPPSLLPTRRDLDTALGELLSRGILRLDGGLLSFKNELHRAFVYYATPVDVRKLYHARLGKVLVARGPSRGDFSNRLEGARHLERGGLHEHAVRAVLKGAPLAIERGAPSEAESVLRAVRAGTHDPQTRRRLDLLLAEALSAQGHYVESLEALDVVDHTLVVDPRAAAMSALLRAQALERTRLGDDEAVRESAERAMTLAEAAGVERLVAAAAQVAAETASELGIPEMLQMAKETTQRLAQNSTSNSTRAQALLTTGFCLLMSGRFEEALRAMSGSAELLRAACSDVELTRALNGQALCHIYLGRHHEAANPLVSALMISRKLNDVAHQVTLLSNLGVAYEDLGMFGEGEQCFAEAAAMLPAKHPRGVVLSNINRAHIALVLGNLDEAASALAVAKRAAAESDAWRLRSLVDFGEADLLLALGEPERAWPIVTRGARRTWGRERSIDTNGKTIRLTLHCALAVGGPSSLGKLVDELRVAPRPLKLADRVEISGFLEWAIGQGALDRELADRSDPQTACRHLLGPIAALSAVGIAASEQWARLPNESAAGMLDRVVPTYQRGVLFPGPDEILAGFLGIERNAV